MQYILISKTTGAKIIFQYDLRGFLEHFDIEGAEQEQQLAFLFWNAKFPFPYLEKLIPDIRKLHLFDITEVPDDLSFERFWKEYNLRVSKKKAEKLWQKLSSAKRIKALLHIKKYDDYLRVKGIEKAYPDTYLRNEKFEDEY